MENNSEIIQTLVLNEIEKLVINARNKLMEENTKVDFANDVLENAIKEKSSEKIKKLN